MAHRMSLKAYLLGGQDLQLLYCTNLYKAFWGESEDIGDTNVLGEIAKTSGVMSKEEVCRFDVDHEVSTMLNHLWSTLGSQIPRDR